MLLRLVAVAIAALLLVACEKEGAAPTGSGPSASPGATAPVLSPRPATIAAATQSAEGAYGATTTPSVSSGFFLRVASPEPESIVGSPELVVTGCTAPGAVVSVGDDVVAVGADGCFRAVVTLEEGPTSLDVVASDRQGREASVALTVIYAP